MVAAFSSFFSSSLVACARVEVSSISGAGGSFDLPVSRKQFPGDPDHRLRPVGPKMPARKTGVAPRGKPPVSRDVADGLRIESEFSESGVYIQLPIYIDFLFRGYFPFFPFFFSFFSCTDDLRFVSAMTLSAFRNEGETSARVESGETRADVNWLATRGKTGKKSEVLKYVLRVAEK